MVLTCGKSGVNICRARVAETGELEETPILLKVPPGAIHIIILNFTKYTTLLGYTKFCHHCLVLTRIGVLLGTNINSFYGGGQGAGVGVETNG